MATEMTFRVTKSELESHFLARVDVHRERAAHHAAEGDKAASEAAYALESANTVTDRISIQNSTLYAGPMNRRDQERQKASAHNNSANRFAWMAAHLPPVQHFDLTETALLGFELFTR